MNDDASDLATRVHDLLTPLRKHVARVSSDFGQRVSSGIEHFLASREEKPPSIFSMLGDMFVDSLNAATRHHARDGDTDNDEDEDDDV